MNGIIDKQTSDNDWGPRTRGMLSGHFLQPDPKPPLSLGEQQIVLGDFERQIEDHEAEFAKTLDALKHQFIFVHPDEVESFLRSYRNLTSILIEATAPLQQAFAQTPIALEVMTEEGAPRSIYALALWNGERPQARAALTAFDDMWGLQNTRKAAGKIVFDYELLK